MVKKKERSTATSYEVTIGGHMQNAPVFPHCYRQERSPIPGKINGGIRFVFEKKLVFLLF